MLALGIRYLTKYAAAADAARQKPEWPPHWGRVFMALAAGHFETESNPDERRVLEWLEAAPPPSLYASETQHRTAVRTYVPVNDTTGGIVSRPRQDRAFQRTRPHEDTVVLIWNSELPSELRSNLAALCRKVTRIGHSSSLVQMWVLDPGSEPEPNWHPEDGPGATRLRITAGGTLRDLELAFNRDAVKRYQALAEALSAARGTEKVRLKREIAARFPDGPPEVRRPQLVLWQAYTNRTEGSDQELPVRGPFEETLVILSKLEGPTLGLETTVQLTGALRNAAMAAAGANPPEWLTGHTETGTPSRREHAAFFPLSYVGYPHADGHIMGLAIALPRSLGVQVEDRDAEIRRRFGPLFFDVDNGDERAIHLWKNEPGGRVWEWTLEREKRERPPVTLQSTTWTRPSRRWASVTPVVLHHHPKKREGDVERIVREAFASALFPEPAMIRITSVSALEGAGHALAVPPFIEGGANLSRYQTHVEAWFSQSVKGPMLVGRGRFRGYGLFKPLAEREAY